MTATSASTPAALLDRALVEDPARPLVTFYDDATGERTELSVATFANWVAKTANLLRDDLDLQPGDRITVDLPVHWQGAVWLQAAWALGLVVTLPGTAGAEGAGGRADLAVVTHDAAYALADQVVSCGLGPMGLARPGSSPAIAAALDYDREVHGHADRFVPTERPKPQDLALVTAGRTESAGSLAAAAVSGPTLDPGARVLLDVPLRTRDAVLAGLLVPLATGVTAVLCRHLDPSRLPDRIEQEGVVVVLGPPRSGLAGWGVTAEGAPDDLD